MTNSQPLRRSAVISPLRRSGKPGWSVRTWRRDANGKVVGTIDWYDLPISTDSTPDQALNMAIQVLNEQGIGVLFYPYGDGGFATVDVVEPRRPLDSNGLEFLTRRVSELEEENRQLRNLLAGLEATK